MFTPIYKYPPLYKCNSDPQTVHQNESIIRRIFQEPFLWTRNFRPTPLFFGRCDILPTSYKVHACSSTSAKRSPIFDCASSVDIRVAFTRNLFSNFLEIVW